MNNAIAECYVLKQEINYIIRTLPVDKNKFKRFGEAIDRQIALYKGVRQSDNRFLRKNVKNNTLVRETASVINAIEVLLDKIEQTEISE